MGDCSKRWLLSYPQGSGTPAADRLPLGHSSGLRDAHQPSAGPWDLGGVLQRPPQGRTDSAKVPLSSRISQGQ